MSRIRLRALGPVSYQGRAYAAGDEFDASRVAAFVFGKRGRAVLASAAPAQAPAPVEPESEGSSPRRRGRRATYQTRDLVADQPPSED